MKNKDEGTMNVTVYLEPSLIAKIDQLKGLYSRSSFIKKILLEEIENDEMGNQ